MSDIQPELVSAVFEIKGSSGRVMGGIDGQTPLMEIFPGLGQVESSADLVANVANNSLLQGSLRNKGYKLVRVDTTWHQEHFTHAVNTSLARSQLLTNVDYHQIDDLQIPVVSEGMVLLETTPTDIVTNNQQLLVVCGLAEPIMNFGPGHNDNLAVVALPVDVDVSGRAQLLPQSDTYSAVRLITMLLPFGDTRRTFNWPVNKALEHTPMQEKITKYLPDLVVQDLNIANNDDPTFFTMHLEKFLGVVSQLDPNLFGYGDRYFVSGTAGGFLDNLKYCIEVVRDKAVIANIEDKQRLVSVLNTIATIEHSYKFVPQNQSMKITYNLDRALSKLEGLVKIKTPLQVARVKNKPARYQASEIV